MIRLYWLSWLAAGFGAAMALSGCAAAPALIVGAQIAAPLVEAGAEGIIAGLHKPAPRSDAGP